jgi:cytochrome c
MPGIWRRAVWWWCVLTVLILSSAAAARADFIGHGAPVRDIVISADGTLALTCGFDDQVILWDVAARQPIHRLEGHEAAVNAVAFLPPDDSRGISAGDDGTLRLWDLESGKELRRFDGHSKKVVSVAVSPDGRLAASASWDRTVRLWDIETGQELRLFEGHENSVNAVVFRPDGEALISAGYDGLLMFWPLAGGTSPSRLASLGFPVSDLQISNDGARLLTGSADGLLRLWNLADREVLQSFQGHEGAVLAVALSSDGRTLASGGTDGQLLIWRAGENGVQQRLEIAHYNAVWSIAFSPQAAIVYAGGIDPVARAWFVATGRPLTGTSTAFQAIDRVSPDAASSDDPVVRGSYHFRKCAVCHSLQEDGVARAGPSLAGIFGRRVGTYPGYRYSKALSDSRLVWTEETVSQLFELGPEVLLPGTKMPLQRLPDARARDDLIAFLKKYTQPH